MLGGGEGRRETEGGREGMHRGRNAADEEGSAENELMMARDKETGRRRRSKRVNGERRGRGGDGKGRYTEWTRGSGRHEHPQEGSCDDAGQDKTTRYDTGAE